MMRALLTSVVLVSLLAIGGLLAQSASDTAWRPKTGPASSLVPPGTPAPGSAESATIAEVIAFEKATEAAVVRGDTAALERALAPTFLFTHGDGWVDGGAPLKVDTKASWIEYVKRRPLPYCRICGNATTKTSTGLRSRASTARESRSEERRDFLGAEAVLLEYGFGVLAEQRRPPARIGRRLAHLDRRSQRPHPAERRMIDLHRHLARDEMRVGEDLRVVVDRTARDVVRLKERQPPFWRASGERTRFRLQLVDAYSDLG